MMPIFNSLNRPLTFENVKIIVNFLNGHLFKKLLLKFVKIATNLYPLGNSMQNCPKNQLKLVSS